MKPFSLFKKEVEEDAPVNVSGNVAGTVGTPPVSKKKQKEYQIKNSEVKLALESSEKFGGAAVFEVDSSTFSSIQLHKKPSARFKSFISDEETCNIIREYARKNPSKDIVIKDITTGSYKFLKKGSKSSF